MFACERRVDRWGPPGDLSSAVFPGAFETHADKPRARWTPAEKKLLALDRDLFHGGEGTDRHRASGATRGRRRGARHERRAFRRALRLVRRPPCVMGDGYVAVDAYDPTRLQEATQPWRAFPTGAGRQSWGNRMSGPYYEVTRFLDAPARNPLPWVCFRYALNTCVTVPGRGRKLRGLFRALLEAEPPRMYPRASWERAASVASWVLRPAFIAEADTAAVLRALDELVREHPDASEDAGLTAAALRARLAPR